MTSHHSPTARPRRRGHLLILACAGTALTLGLTSCGVGAEPAAESARAMTSAPATEAATPTDSTVPSPAASAAASATGTPDGTPDGTPSAAASTSPAAAASSTTSTSAVPARAPRMAAAPASTPASTATSTATSTAVRTPSSSPSATVPQATAITVFWVMEGDAGASGQPIGCGDSLVRATAPTSGPGLDTEDRVATGIETLLQQSAREVDPDDAGQPGLTNALYQSEMTVRNVSISGDVVTVGLDGFPLSAGTCDAPRIVEQLEQTAAANAGVSTARILVNDGTPIDEFFDERG